MSTLNPTLLSLSDVIPIMEELFSYNEKLVLLITKNNEIINKNDSKGNRIFKISLDSINSVKNIINYAKKINELRGNTFIKVKKGNIDNSTLNKFKELDKEFPKLIKDYVLLLQSLRNTLQSTKEFTEKEKGVIDNNLGKELYEIMDIENNILNIITKVLENNVKESPTFSYKEEDKSKHTCEIKTDGQIFIDGIFSEVKLTPKLSTLLKKLTKLDKNGNFPFIKTEDLADGWKRNNDAFRTKLSRLRKETGKLFEIKNVDNKYNESCYTIIFKD